MSCRWTTFTRRPCVSGVPIWPSRATPKRPRTGSAPDTGAVIDITGYSARMQIRETIDAADYVYQALSGGDISLGGVTGQVALSIPAALTAARTFGSRVYDLELVSPAGKV